MHRLRLSQSMCGSGLVTDEIIRRGRTHWICENTSWWSRGVDDLKHCSKVSYPISWSRVLFWRRLFNFRCCYSPKITMLNLRLVASTILRIRRIFEGGSLGSFMRIYKAVPWAAWRVTFTKNSCFDNVSFLMFSIHESNSTFSQKKNLAEYNRSL